MNTSYDDKEKYDDACQVKNNTCDYNTKNINCNLTDDLEYCIARFIKELPEGIVKHIDFVRINLK